MTDQSESVDAAAFAEMVAPFRRELLVHCYRMLGSVQDAEDALQESLISAWRNVPEFEGRSSLKTWAFRIVANIAKTRGTKESRSVPFSAATVDGEEGPAVDPDRFQPPGDRYPGHWQTPPEPWPEHRLEAAETRNAALAAIAGLPARQREIITLRDIAGFSAEEARNALDVTETNQRVLLHRARSTVRNALESHFDAAEDR